ncbi:hypothetical protein B0H13DRAFT_2113922 [Mycena leptocephala]|nr:hypothetical protein B0H13DRAFT_2113922 [Mycena leptocephala]
MSLSTNGNGKHYDSGVKTTIPKSKNGTKNGVDSEHEHGRTNISSLGFVGVFCRRQNQRSHRLLAGPRAAAGFTCTIPGRVPGHKSNATQAPIRSVLLSLILILILIPRRQLRPLPPAHRTAQAWLLTISSRVFYNSVRPLRRLRAEGHRDVRVCALFHLPSFFIAFFLFPTCPRGVNFSMGLTLNPYTYEMVLPINTGAEVVENALKLARARGESANVGPTYLSATGEVQQRRLGLERWRTWNGR